MAEQRDDYLQLEDKALLDACEVHTYKASGPGGQHRNKVSSAVRLVHRPTGITAHGNESRSQHDNKRVALKRLRMHLACELRCPAPPADAPLPDPLAECIFPDRNPATPADRKKLSLGRKDHRFWRVAGFVLDVLEAFEGQTSAAAAHLGISTGNLVSFLKSERHLFTAAQETRRRFGHKPLH